MRGEKVQTSRENRRSKLEAVPVCWLADRSRTAVHLDLMVLLALLCPKGHPKTITILQFIIKMGKGGPILSRAALLLVFRIKCVPDDVMLFMGAQARTHVSDYLADNATCFCWHHVSSTWVIHEWHHHDPIWENKHIPLALETKCGTHGLKNLWLCSAFSQ